MKKHELLSPAGNMECLQQAVLNGADAVYLGCKNFGARKFASNFTNEEIIEAIKYCHLYGVKIYVTMNTLVKDCEVDDFLKQVEFLHSNGIDAILIQDFGMLCLIREKYPNLEVHASTQANTSSKETAQLFYNLGVKRVVFSREMTLEEINSIDVPIEKEVFVHGALCICYSGCCLMSSQIGNRSGNRGECAGSCRLPYSLKYNDKIIESNKYLLSTKELNTSKNIQELLNSNIDCFKIEGRMKSPEYVGFITKFYRNLIDNYDKFDIEDANNKLKTIFNRGFTQGHLFKTSIEELMNRKSPNHIGLEIGKVLEVTKDKIKIKLDKELCQEDGIRFLNSNKGLIVNYLYDKNMKLTNSSHDICYIDNKVGLTEKDIICKTIDSKLNKELRRLPERKVPITIFVTAHIDENLKITIKDDLNEVNVFGEKVSKSINMPLSEARIKEQVTKLGNTPFICNNIELNCSKDIFISIKSLNELRREAINNLIYLRENKKQEVIVKDIEFSKISLPQESGISASVYNEEQLLACQDMDLSRIYVNDKALYEKYQNNPKIYYKIPRCQRNISTSLKQNVLTPDYFDFTQTKNVIGDYSLNVYNIYTAYYLYKFGIKTITLSVELTPNDIFKFVKEFKSKFNFTPNFEVLSYGLIENMIIKGDILNIPQNNYEYELIDTKNRIFPVYYDGTNTHILNYKCVNSEEIEYLKNICFLRLDFYKESSASIKSIVNKLKEENL